MLNLNKTIPTILAAIAAIAMSGAQPALADHDHDGWHDHHVNVVQTHQYTTNYGRNRYHNDRHYRGYNRHHKTIKHEIRHIVRNL